MTCERPSAPLLRPEKGNPSRRLQERPIPRGRWVKPRRKSVPQDKKKIPVAGGQEVDATVMPFQVGSENWNEYLLEDGTVLRVKLVATEVVKVDDAYNANNEPVYLIRSQNIVAPSVPDRLMRKKGQK
jgi:hypothetical protein